MPRACSSVAIDCATRRLLHTRDVQIAILVIAVAIRRGGLWAKLGQRSKKHVDEKPGPSLRIWRDQDDRAPQHPPCIECLLQSTDKGSAQHSSSFGATSCSGSTAGSFLVMWHECCFRLVEYAIHAACYVEGLLMWIGETHTDEDLSHQGVTTPNNVCLPRRYRSRNAFRHLGGAPRPRD